MSGPEPRTPEDEVAQVAASFALDGVELTEEERALLLRYARGEITREEYTRLVRERLPGPRRDDGDRSDG